MIITTDARRVLEEEVLVGGIERKKDDEKYSWEEQRVSYNGRVGRLKFEGNVLAGIVILNYDQSIDGEADQLFLSNAENFSQTYEIVDGELKRKKLMGVYNDRTRINFT